MNRDTVEALEKQFWEGDATFYEEHLSDDALMVFPEPVGILTRPRIIETVCTGRRWSSVTFERIHFLELEESVLMLMYTARARRMGQDGEYRALASSAYTRRRDRFLLAFHQQTPAHS